MASVEAAAQRGFGSLWVGVTRRRTLSSRPASLRREDSEHRLLEIALPDGACNTMLFRRDGPLTKLHDLEGVSRVDWEARGSSGYRDPVDERQP